MSTTIIYLAATRSPASGKAASAPRPGRPGLLARLKEFGRRLRTRRMLATFDDATLRDIGVTRSDAEQEAAKPFWRP